MAVPVTAPARITQADIDRAVKAASKADKIARVIMRLDAAEIEIIIGDVPQPSRPPVPGREPGDDGSWS